jgi:serine/threonine protein kinase
MGVVYLGLAKDGSEAAIKVLRPELADDHEFRARFRREVAVLARVQGLCTVRVIEADTQSARPFLATEYADGPSLAEHIGQSGPLGPRVLLGLATGLAEALSAIHTAGVIHRDLKPSNVLLTHEGPRVIDFGIAQTMDATAFTRTGMTVGSPGFMAPEQITGKAGQPADIFSWGLTVAYAASGQPPFGTGPTDAIMYRIIHDSPEIAAVPAELQSLVAAALAKNPDNRPTASDLLRHLTGGAGATDAAADARTRTVLARTWLLPSPPMADPAAGIVAGGRRRFPLVLVSAAGVALAIAAGAGVALAGSQSRQPTARPTITITATTKATRTGVSATAPAPTIRPASQSSSSAAQVTGRCVTGMLDLDDNEFISMSNIAAGESLPSTAVGIAEAYQLTLTDSPSSGTAEVTGYAVAFYSDGQELTSDSESLNEPVFITPGQSLIWTEHPWGTYSPGEASVGPFAAGTVGAVDPGATCELIEWHKS